jgi:hypothetical protein
MMTVIEMRFMEVVVRQLPLLVKHQQEISKRLEEIIELLKQQNNGNDTRKRL